MYGASNLKSKSSVLSVLVLLLILATMTFAQTSTILPISDAPEGYKLIQTQAAVRCRRPAQENDLVAFQYKGVIAPNSTVGTPGHVFDETKDSSLVLMLSERKLITGLYHALQGGCEGERRQVTIPSDWAYGDSGFNDVPGKATVEFNLLITRIEPLVDVFHDVDTNGDNCIEKEEIKHWLLRQDVTDVSADEGAGKILKHDDDNGDSVITCDEFTGTTHCEFHPPMCFGKNDE